MSEDGDSVKQPKRRSCSECHKCKSKCVYPKHPPAPGDHRCERCIRLKKELCVPHISRQGKRKSLDYLSDTSSSQQQQQQYTPHQHHQHLLQQHQQQQCQQVTSSSTQLVGGGPTNNINMAAAAAALAISNPNTIGNQSQIMDMIESMKNGGGGDGGSTSNSGLVATGATTGTNTLLNNHMLGGGGNNFHPNAASVNNTHHHLAQQIQNNTLFAKNSNLLQQQQQQQQHPQQSYLQQAAGDVVVNNMINSGLTTILSRAIGDNHHRNAEVVATTVSSGGGGGGGANNNNVAVGGGNNNNFANNVSGLSANLLSGLDPNTLSRVIHQLSNNSNSGSGGGGGGGLGSNNLDLLYQAANSQSNQQQQQQQGVGYNVGGNQLKDNNAPSNSRIGNNNTTTTATMMFSQEKRRNSTGCIASYPSPQLSQQHNNAKSTAPVSSSSGVVNNNNINNSGQQQIRADSRLKKQKKHHKFFPPEYPPVSLLQSHSASGTPSSSQAGEGNLSRSSSTQNFITPEEAIGSHYMSACARHSELTLSSLKHHYGLQCQIREWISMALARRSFALLSKASSLAHRCNMHMDRILSGGFQEDDCGTEHNTNCKNKKCAGPRMHYLLSMLLEPQSKIRIPIEDRHMLLPHFPPAFLSVIGCQNGQFFQESEIRNRWIIVRETRCGISRFFCSPAFERNVLCWAHVSQIFEDNLADIHSLIFVKDQFRRFLACNAYQIWSHSDPGMPPRPVHAPRTRVRLLSKRWGLANYQDDGVTNPVTKTMIQQVDDVMTLEMDLLFVSFPTMDKTTYYLEFFHSATNATPVIENSSSIPRGLSNVSLHMEAGEDLSQDRHQQQSPESSNANPPTFDDIMESEEWVGIDDVMASGDINELMDALLN
jgi:hypothetical protein